MKILNVFATGGKGAGRTTGQDISDAMKILTRNGGRADTAPATATRNTSLRNGRSGRPQRNNGSEQMRLF